MITKPKIFVCYVNNVFSATHFYDKINKLKQALEKNSVLNFTTELNINKKKIPFLNVLTDSNNNNKLTTSPYKKPTSYNSTLFNYHSECPQKYKIAIIKNLIHRTFYISSKIIFYKELTNIKQTLVNNNFPNKQVNQQMKLYLYNIHKNNNTTNNNNANRMNLYYRNQMQYNYKLDKQAITNIIKTQKQIKLIIYYTEFKTSNLIVENNTNSAKILLNQTNVVYKFVWPFRECLPNNKNYIYIGYTRCLTYHLS